MMADIVSYFIKILSKTGGKNTSTNYPEICRNKAFVYLPWLYLTFL